MLSLRHPTPAPAPPSNTHTHHPSMMQCLWQEMRAQPGSVPRFATDSAQYEAPYPHPHPILQHPHPPPQHDAMPVARNARPASLRHPTPAPAPPSNTHTHHPSMMQCLWQEMRAQPGSVPRFATDSAQYEAPYPHPHPILQHPHPPPQHDAMPVARNARPAR
ncbi:velvet complex subunit 2-like [Schistocerca piceifrons]|uniref:velvet complex subunit 2-like n=1 Tax=Schistocerca piceifrons TaxID=274613 RepID=UPI001F5F6ACF|nr:velvet complex subunit 2-like [Schistocerca piceifrons]